MRLRRNQHPLPLPLSSLLLFAAFFFFSEEEVVVNAQPAPAQQKRITRDIKDAANLVHPDYTKFVNPFIGTDNWGDVCPGASIPFGMVKFTTDMTGYAPAGYVASATESIRGISPLHDSGTGSSLGTYGNFEVMPLLCPDGFMSCNTTLVKRQRLRKNLTDDASPGYFSLTLDNDIQMEATPTRRAGLERFTFPTKTEKPYFAIDLSNDLPNSFAGGTLDIDPVRGRIKIAGRWGSSFGPGRYNYQAFACYDLLKAAKGAPKQELDEWGVWTGDAYGMDAKGLGQTHLNLSLNLIGGVYQSGALFSFKLPSAKEEEELLANATSLANSTSSSSFNSTTNSTSSFNSTTTDPSGNSTDPAFSTSAAAAAAAAAASKKREITFRVGVSFVSVDQACQNAEEEVGDLSFEEVWENARILWQEQLSRVEVDLKNTPVNVTEMLYSSLYRSALTPNNATGETQGVFADTKSYYFDSLYCSWDTYRTLFPLMALTSPVEYAQIVENYIDGWRKNGWMPECRANNLPGWTQGGSSADNIVGHFAVNYHNEAKDLGIDLNELYAAMWTDGEVNPPEWNIHGRQVNVYKEYGYVPYSVLDTSSTGRQTREGSRTLEYAFEDFAIRQVAQLLGKEEDVATYTNRSLSYRNIWDPDVKSDGFKGFFQKRYPNGTFAYNNPVDCSPNDESNTRQCSLQGGNLNGFYESSSWEYSWFAPHDTAYLIELMGGVKKFVKRLDHFFDAGYYLAGNEPSFQTPVGYHYADQPTKSVDRVREVVANNFDITPAGLPGNDDQAAMASLLAFHLLGLYPVPSTTHFLIISPFIPSYTIHNRYLNTSTTITAVNYDSKSVRSPIPKNTPAYVANVTVNGVPTASRCHFDFYDVFRVGGEVLIELTADKKSVDSCGEGGLPESISTGGFGGAR